MELTRRCDYACRILRSAYRHKDTYISIADVAEEEDIPYAFARTIQHDLATAGYLKTVRGARGGLSLSIDPAEVTVLDVLSALQGPVAVSPCSADPESCEKSDWCSFNKVWLAADNALHNLFGSLTLLDVFENGTDPSSVNEAVSATDELVSRSLEDLAAGRNAHGTSNDSADAKAATC